MRIVANMALSLDGKLGAAKGEPKMFGGPADRRRMHEGRAKAGMVLCGGATFRDWPIPPRIDPQLVGSLSPTPPLLVVTRRGLLAARTHPQGFPSPDCPLIMFGVPEEQSDEHVRRFGGRVMPCSDPLKEALFWAESQGVEELLVEGGGELIASLLDSDKLDELRLCLCPLLFGPGGPAAFGGPPRSFSQARELKLLSVEEEGGRLFTSWAPRPRTGGSAGQAGVFAAPPGGGRKDGQNP
jgi:riboflavin biosynthesis pyrimidine reductase